MNKTTEQDFELFKTECEYWLDRFSLRGWRVFYRHEDFDDAFAWAKSYSSSRTCDLCLGINWNDTEISDFVVCRSAFHEVVELMLSGMTEIAGLDICPSDESDYAEKKHSVIRRLEHSVWKPDYEKRNK